MTFPTAAQAGFGDFHTEDGALYAGTRQNRWNRAGEKDLPVDTSFSMYTNQFGILSTLGPRPAQEKIVMNAVWDPSRAVTTKIYLAEPNGTAIDVSTHSFAKYNMHTFWGGSGESLTNVGHSRLIPDANGVMLCNNTRDLIPKDGEHHFVEVSINRIVRNWSYMAWRTVYRSGNGSPIECTGQINFNFDVSRIGKVGLSFNGNPVISHATIHAQWW